MNIQEKIVEEYKVLCHEESIKKNYVFPSSYKKLCEIDRKLELTIILKR